MSIRDNAARKAAADEGNIDLTPMLDVVFIMLIFFIVTSSFVTTRIACLWIARPAWQRVPRKKRHRRIL